MTLNVKVSPVIVHGEHLPEALYFTKCFDVWVSLVLKTVTKGAFIIFRL